MDLSRNLTKILTIFTPVTYFFGYLILRARAHALGLDPYFSLINEGYIFAGIRFVLMTLVTLLVLSPFLLGMYKGTSALFQRIPSSLSSILQWIGLFFFAVLTLMMLKVFGVKGILLISANTDAQLNMFEEILIKGQTVKAMALMILSIWGVSLSVLWFINAYAKKNNGPLMAILAIIVSLQVFILPIYHGVLMADRKVRVLSYPPACLTSVLHPVGIIERANTHYTLIGKDRSGKNFVVTIKQEDLNGIPVQNVLSLNSFLKLKYRPVKAKQIPG